VKCSQPINSVSFPVATRPLDVFVGSAWWLIIGYKFPGWASMCKAGVRTSANPLRFFVAI
jgi:hypothetical protein